MFSPIKYNIPKAGGKRYAHNLSREHLTTMDFGLLRPVLVQHMNPNEKINVDMQVFSRVAPLAFPVLGDMYIVSRAFFVPYRLVFDGWQDFISNKLYNTKAGMNFTTPQIPTFTNEQFIKAFVNLHLNPNTQWEMYTCQRLDSATGADISYPLYNGTNLVSTAYYKLTPFGKALLALLNSLGYEFVFAVHPQANSVKFSLLPLLAFMKVFQDWFSDPRYESNIDRLLHTSGLEIIDTDFTTDPIGVLGQESNMYGILELLVTCMYSLLPPDVFNCCSHESGMIDSFVSQNRETGYSVDDGELVADDGNYGVRGDGYNLSDVFLSALKGFSNFVRRNNLVGQRYVDQILARFGVRPSEVLSDRCQYLGSSSTYVEVKDVTATAAGEATIGGNAVKTSLGDYTGKAIAGSEGSHFIFETKSDNSDAGLFIVVSVVLPSIKYCAQLDPVTQFMDLYDFYTPEFDCLGSESVPNSFVKSGYLNGSDWAAGLQSGTKQNGVFGYWPRYTRNKIAFDKLTGDFRVPSLVESMRCTHLFREIPAPDTYDPLTNNLEFETISPNMRNNLARIFLYNTDEYEHFYVRFGFNVRLDSIMKPIYDNMFMDEEEYKNGTISMPVHGRRF